MSTSYQNLIRILSDNKYNGQNLFELQASGIIDKYINMLKALKEAIIPVDIDAVNPSWTAITDPRGIDIIDIKGVMIKTIRLRHTGFVPKPKPNL